MTQDTAINIENTTALTEYLVQNEHIRPDESPSIQILTGGVSNRSVLLERANGEVWVIKQALARLRVEADWFSDPARIQREALGIRWLARFTPPGTIPKLVFQDVKNHILAMSAVPQPHTNWKTMLLQGDVDPAHVIQFAQILAGIHRQSHQQRDNVEPIFRERRFFESLRVEPYYSYTAAQRHETVAFYERLIAATRVQVHTLVHGDFSPKNILIHDGRLVLLDHEVIHFGDPAFDIGFSMTHLLSKAHHVIKARQAFLSAAHTYWTHYLENTVSLTDFEDRAVRHTLACILARVDGRSPLEYLTDQERHTQRHTALRLMKDMPPTMPALINLFAKELNH